MPSNMNYAIWTILSVCVGGGGGGGGEGGTVFMWSQYLKKILNERVLFNIQNIC